jgi:NAD(P)-dependent dehydrogenase (short-subunit alcohol dehydrogenase family)
MIFSLENMTVVIVGGAGLIGSALARAAAENGARVVIADIDKKKGASLAEKIGGAYEHIDSSSPASIEHTAKRVQKRFKTIDSLILTSYPRTRSYGAGPDKIPFKDFSEFIAKHVGGSFWCAQAFSKLMKKGGSMVFLGSIYGTAAPKFDIYKGTPMTMPAEYAAAKGSVLQLTRYLAVLYGPRGIRVNAVSPGGIFNGQSKKFVNAYGKHSELGSGMLDVDDVVGALLFLTSDASAQITGQNIIVDGGWTL